MATQTDQTGAQGEATRLRSQRDLALDALITDLMKIQFAADAAWPYTIEANHATLMEFQLPASRPLHGLTGNAPNESVHARRPAPA